MSTYTVESIKDLLDDAKRIEQLKKQIKALSEVMNQLKIDTNKLEAELKFLTVRMNKNG